MLRNIVVASLVILTGCVSTHPNAPVRVESLTVDESDQVDSLLNKLYRSFSYEAGEEPDWDLMRSVFFDDAQFVTEPPEGGSAESTNRGGVYLKLAGINSQERKPYSRHGRMDRRISSQQSGPVDSCGCSLSGKENE